MNKVRRGSDGTFLKIAFMFTIIALLLIFAFWAQNTRLDLLTRGMGRVVAAEENKSVQSAETGTITDLRVAKGDYIERNSVLATINPTAAQGSLDELLSRRDTIKVQIARLDAEIDGSGASQLNESLKIYDASIVSAEMALFYARSLTLKQKISGLQTEFNRILESLVEKEQELNGLKELVDILELERQDILPLVQKGVLGQSERFRLDRENSRLQSQIKVLKAQIEQVQLSKQKVQNEIGLVENEFLEKAYDERAKLVAQLSEVNSRIPTLQQNLKETQILAPISGTINELSFNSPGAFVRAGDAIAEIVPFGENLKIIAYVDPKDIGFIEPGQECRIALTAFDAARYGYMTGKLDRVAADATFREDSNAFMFAIEVSFDNQLRDSRGKTVDVLPGMVAQVDVVRGQRSVLEYIWQPIAKIKDDAFRQ